jgi:hypothetical protein
MDTGTSRLAKASIFKPFDQATATFIDFDALTA